MQSCLVRRRRHLTAHRHSQPALNAGDHVVRPVTFHQTTHTMENIYIRNRSLQIVLILFATPLSAACSPHNQSHALHSGIPQSHTSRINSPQSTSIRTTNGDLKAFVGKDRVLDTKRGDLTGNGREDVLLVLDQSPTDSNVLGQGQPRVVVLLVRDANGQLHEAAKNSKLVPCARCGGLYGDPYSYTRLGAGRFTLVTEGGSREHWSNKYTFAYSKKQHDWLLRVVKRKVFDRLTEKGRSLSLTTKTFGQVRFSKADPYSLPNDGLP